MKPVRIKNCVWQILMEFFHSRCCRCCCFMTFFRYFQAGVLELVFSVCDVDIAAAKECIACIQYKSIFHRHTYVVCLINKNYMRRRLYAFSENHKKNERLHIRIPPSISVTFTLTFSKEITILLFIFNLDLFVHSLRFFLFHLFSTCCTQPRASSNDMTFQRSRKMSICLQQKKTSFMKINWCQFCCCCSCSFSTILFVFCFALFARLKQWLLLSRHTHCVNECSTT